MALPGSDRTGGQEQLTGIIGLTTAAVPSTPVGATANGDMQNADLLNVSVVQTILSVTHGTIVAARVGTSNLANRKMILIQAGTANLSYGFSATLTPFILPNQSTFSLALGPNQTLYVGNSALTGTGTFSVAELS